MTENVELSDCEKTIMNADEPIYGDLITEIDLHVVEDSTTDDKVKESLTDLVEPNTNLVENNPDIPTETEAYANSDILPQDDTVSEFFTVDSKPDEFENDMLIGELDNEGIDFKNDTDIAECHHEYESKKLLFGDCEDIVEVVNNSDEQSEVTEDVPENQETVVVVAVEVDADIVEEIEKIDDADSSFVQAEEEDESLNRMHVMEDVEEGCDVSGALPSSPGHAEQRPDPPKQVPEISSPIQQLVETETTLPVDKVLIPIENGVATEDEDTPTKPIIEDPPILEKPVKEDEEKSETLKIDQEHENEATNDDEKKQLDNKAKDLIDIEETTNKSNEDVTKDSSKRDEEYSCSGSESSRGSQTSSTSKRKRTDEDDCTAPTKKLRKQIQKQYANHDRILNDYIEASNFNSIEELQVHTEQLLAEIRTLNELAREKEREWNNILHLKKVKEELLLRMQRKKQIMIMSTSDKNDIDWDISIEQEERFIKDGTTKSGGNLMMVPVVSSSPSVTTNRNNSRDANYKSEKMYNNNSKTRSILPKHTTLADLNGQECRQGRQGPILDVRSIIADYRQRHPETVPRRGRRMKSVLNTHSDGKPGSAGNVLSMASLALGSGSQMRHNSADMSSELGFLLSTMDSMRQENSRSSNSDSSMLSNEAAMSFKDVLVQFARLSQSERQELQAQAAASLAASTTNKPPPPPYPEVTLHPVPSAQVPQAATVPIAQNQNNSLLHGILTKTQPRAENKPTTFSPTLARLLTAPERVSNNSAQAMYTAALNSGVSISDLLSTGKSRNEITITPVGQYGQNIKHKDGEHFIEEEEAEDSADRLVIDEGSDLTSTERNRATTDNGSEGGDDVPQCQGCHQKSAQFVCAGCGNQWYCSRDCQVAAWDEHSEVCSG